MRTRNVMRNTAYSVISYALLAVLGLLVRKCFLQCIDVMFLGYEGLFGNVFSLLALADFGIESVIYYRLFPAFSKQDISRITKLLAIYKNLYKLAGLIILVLGIAILPFLQFIISDDISDWNYIRMIYLLQLSAVLSTYFLAYKRILFTVSQKESENTKVDFLCMLFSSITRIGVIIIFQSYILYLLTAVIFNIIANCVIAFRVNREFSFVLYEEKASLHEIYESGILKDLKDGMILKICGTVYSGTDNIVISAFLGVEAVGLYSNYVLVSSKVNQIISKVTNPIQASIGNFVYSEDKCEGNRIFRMFDLLSFFLASFTSISYFVLFNPFITIIFGKQYTLGILFVLFFAINTYMTYVHMGIALYRNCFGRYDIDRKYTVASAMLNIVSSVLLVKPLGIAGVMLGTAVCQFGFWAGRVSVVFSEYLIEKKGKYILRQVRNAVLAVFEMAVTIFISGVFPASIFGFLGKLVICLAVPNLMNLIFFWKTDEISLAQIYVKNVYNIIRGSLKQKER